MNSIDISVGKEIQLIRKQSGLDQVAFAEQCGISKTHYGRLERGENSMTLATFYLISKELGISMSDILKMALLVPPLCIPIIVLMSCIRLTPLRFHSTTKHGL